MNHTEAIFTLMFRTVIDVEDIQPQKAEDESTCRDKLFRPDIVVGQEPPSGAGSATKL